MSMSHERRGSNGRRLSQGNHVNSNHKKRKSQEPHKLKKNSTSDENNKTSTPGVYPGGYSNDDPPEEIGSLTDIQHYGGYPSDPIDPIDPNDPTDPTDPNDPTDQNDLSDPDPDPEVNDDADLNMDKETEAVVQEPLKERAGHSIEEGTGEIEGEKHPKVHVSTDPDYYNCACCRMSSRTLLTAIVSIGMLLGLIFLAIGIVMNYGEYFGYSSGNEPVIGPKPPSDCNSTPSTSSSSDSTTSSASDSTTSSTSDSTTSSTSGSTTTSSSDSTTSSSSDSTTSSYSDSETTKIPSSYSCSDELKTSNQSFYKESCTAFEECFARNKTWHMDDKAYKYVAHLGYIGHGLIMVLISLIVLIVILGKFRNLPKNWFCRWIILSITIVLGIGILLLELLMEVYVIVASFESSHMWIRLLAFPPLLAYNLLWILIQLKTDSFKKLKPTEVEEVEAEVVEQQYYVNICCCKCIKQDDVTDAYRSLFAIVFDWLVDFGIGTLHIVQGNWLSGIGTYFIVLYAGVIITFTNFSPVESREGFSIVKGEIWKMSKFYGILMYVPSFFPVCSARLSLFYASKLKECDDEEERIELKRKMEVFKDQALWDICCESFFESIPQAILQIVLLFRAPYVSITEYLPITTVFWAIYGITGAPITVIQERHKDIKMSGAERLTAYASTALRVFSCALFISAVLTFMVPDMDEHRMWKQELLWASIASIVIFSLLCVPQIIKYELGQIYPTWSLCHLVITDAFIFLVTLSSFYLWMFAEIMVLKNDLVTPRKLTVIGLYSALMYFSCAGVLLYRKKLELYHSITATVLLNFYLGIKSGILKTCCKRSHQHERRTSVSM